MPLGLKIDILTGKGIQSWQEKCGEDVGKAHTLPEQWSTKYSDGPLWFQDHFHSCIFVLRKENKAKRAFPGLYTTVIHKTTLHEFCVSQLNSK